MASAVMQHDRPMDEGAKVRWLVDIHIAIASRSARKSASRAASRARMGGCVKIADFLLLILFPVEKACLLVPPDVRIL